MISKAFHLALVLEGKRANGSALAARPIGEKLRLLNALRERELSIRGRATPSDTGVLREETAPYRTKPE